MAFQPFRFEEVGLLQAEQVLDGRHGRPLAVIEEDDGDAELEDGPTTFYFDLLPGILCCFSTIWVEQSSCS